jgi:uncharacterized membrane protein YkvA (DUF1232 family)
MLASLKRRVEDLKRETFALYLATRDPRTPWYAKAFVAVVVAYAVSPIDLIPDFIPVLGVLDDLILIPAGAWIAYRLIPAEVLDDCRRRARESMAEGRPSGRAAAVVVIAIWLALAAACALWAWEAFAPRGP